MSDIRDFSPLWGEWKIMEPKLGEGSFGTVWKVYKNDPALGTVYAAVKHISIPKDEQEINTLLDEGIISSHQTARQYYDSLRTSIAQEISAMHKLRGYTNLVSYEDHLIIPKPDGIGYDLFLRMELLTPLSERVKRGMTVEEIVKLGIDIATAIEVLNKHGYVHRDIKPQNVFVNEIGNYELGDFGTVRDLRRAVTMSQKGTYNYMAPEIYKGQSADWTVDIYSLGIMLYRYVNGNRLPFLPVSGEITAETSEQAFTKRMSGVPLPAPAYADEKLSAIILKACAYKPSDRYHNGTELKNALTAYLTNSKQNGKRDVFVEEPPTLPSSLPSRKRKEKKKGKAYWYILPAFLLLAAIGVGLFGILSQRSQKSSEIIPAYTPAATALYTATAVPEPVATTEPTPEPTVVPTAEPTPAPTAVPTAEPTPTPTAAPTAEPTPEPTTAPTAEPTPEPTAAPTAEPTPEPTAAPTATPTIAPTEAPTADQKDDSDSKLDEMLISYIDENLNTHYFSSWEELSEWTRQKYGKESPVSDFTFNALTDTTCEVTRYIGNDTEIVIPGTDAEGRKVVAIGENAFADNDHLVSIIIPSNVERIGDFAFWYCTNLSNLIISDGVKIIENWAFHSCRKLKSVKIPASIVSVGHQAFSYCDSLQKISVSSENKDYCDIDGVLYNKEKTTIQIYPAGKQDNTYAILNGTTTIAPCSFDGCNSLTSITIPDSVASIDEGEFGDCENLTSIEVSSDNKNYCSVDGILFKKSKTLLFEYPAGRQGKYTIPSNVTELGEMAFGGCKGLTGIIIPDNVTNIGMIVFSGCENLTSVVIPNGVQGISWMLFRDCINLTNVTIPDSVTFISGYAFWNCTSLTNIIIPKSVTDIDDSAFEGCSNLTIHGEIGSKAEEYAKKNGIPFAEVNSANSSAPENQTDALKRNVYGHIAWDSYSMSVDYDAYSDTRNASTVIIEVDQKNRVGKPSEIGLYLDKDMVDTLRGKGYSVVRFINGKAILKIYLDKVFDNWFDTQGYINFRVFTTDPNAFGGVLVKVEAELSTGDTIQASKALTGLVLEGKTDFSVAQNGIYDISN